MAQSSTSFGAENGNRPGRKPGIRNKRDEELWNNLQEDEDPAKYLKSIIKNDTLSPDLRALASNYLLPYLYGKRGAIPTPRYIEEPVNLPRATTIEQANENIALISEMKSLGQIDLEFADSLIADNRTIANNIIAEEELKLKQFNASNDDPSTPRRIVIEGGLPELPGTNISMPHLNGVSGQGSELNGHTLDLEKNPGPPALEAASPAPDPPAEDPQP